jgi:hypothetical protein
MRAPELTKALGGRWHGSYGTACCPAHDDRSPSLSISERDGRLLWRCHAGCDQGAVLEALQARGLLDEGQQSHSAPRSCGRSNGELALEIWRASQLIEGTEAEAYVRSRGITLDLPPSLRCHRNLTHSKTGLTFPAMVAAVQGPDRRVTAIHRTFLLRDGRGKARVSSPKMALGPLGRGAVRLGPLAPALGLAEGIETALSASQLFEIPCWAALGSRLDQVELPAEVIEVQIFGDNGTAGHEAAQKAAEAFRAAGRRVVLRFPPERFPDWNDALQAEAAA